VAWAAARPAAAKIEAAKSTRMRVRRMNQFLKCG
jgi:hypothetical protein